MKKFILSIILFCSFLASAQIKPNLPSPKNKSGQLLGSNGTTYTWTTGQSYTTAASSSTVNLNGASYISITGTTTINFFSTAAAGTEKVILISDSLTITNSSYIILFGNASIAAKRNDILVMVSDGDGIWRAVTYTTYSDGYTFYVPSLTGFSSNPTGIISSYKFLTRNTIHWKFYATVPGTSNATTTTITAPLTMDNGALQMISANGRDNGVDCAATVRTRANSNIVDCYKTFIGSWTNSGSKTIAFSAVFQIQL